MKLIDSHTHLFLPEFDNDREEVILRAQKNHVSAMILPNIDSSTIEPLMNLCTAHEKYCFPLLGLHPGSVDENFQKELEFIQNAIDQYKPIGIGEIGIDLYWDTTYADQQEECFRIQLEWAKQLRLPVAIHVRNSHNEVMKIIKEVWSSNLTGVFHCFTGGKYEAEEIMEAGFYFGIGGVLTFKNSGLKEVLKNIPPEKVIIETDAPYLAPVPFRGKRNESSYLFYIIEHLSGIYSMSIIELSEVIFENTRKLFSLW